MNYSLLFTSNVLFQVSPEYCNGESEAPSTAATASSAAIAEAETSTGELAIGYVKPEEPNSCVYQ